MELQQFPESVPMLSNHSVRKYSLISHLNLPWSTLRPFSSIRVCCISFAWFCCKFNFNLLKENQSLDVLLTLLTFHKQPFKQLFTCFFGKVTMESWQKHHCSSPKARGSNSPWPRLRVRSRSWFYPSTGAAPYTPGCFSGYFCSWTTHLEQTSCARELSLQTGAVHTKQGQRGKKNRRETEQHENEKH